MPGSNSATLEIYLLGPFRVAVDGQSVGEQRWSRRKPTLLVKLLALQPYHQLHREQVMELLWPELQFEAASNNLHKAIHMARRALEPEIRFGSRLAVHRDKGSTHSLASAGKAVDRRGGV